MLFYFIKPFRLATIRVKTQQQQENAGRRVTITKRAQILFYYTTFSHCGPMKRDKS